MEEKPYEEILRHIDRAESLVQPGENWGQVRTALISAAIEADEDSARIVVEAAKKVLEVMCDFSREHYDGDVEPLFWLMHNVLKTVACEAQGIIWFGTLDDTQALLEATKQIIAIGADALKVLKPKADSLRK
jgi:hypothetical protein